MERTLGVTCVISQSVGDIPPPSHRVASAVDPKCHAAFHAPIMMTVLDWTPVRPGIGAAARATMNGYTARTLLVKKNLCTGRRRVLPSCYIHTWCTTVLACTPQDLHCATISISYDVDMST